VKADPAATSGNGTAKAAPAPAKRGSESATATPATATGEDGSGPAAGALGGAAGGSGTGDGLPLAGYDGLTLPQLRARMRTLEPAQLRALVAHERASAGRDEVVAMLERRIAKVESGG